MNVTEQEFAELNNRRQGTGSNRIGMGEIEREFYELHSVFGAAQQEALELVINASNGKVLAVNVEDLRTRMESASRRLRRIEDKSRQ